MKQLTAIVIGAGLRGRIYADFALQNPGKLKIVGVAEPLDDVRAEFAEKYEIPEENCFTTWQDVFKRKKFADVVMICTQDKMHYEPSMAAIEAGYDILLEKPIAPSPEECFAIADAAEKKGVKVVVCHVLRYTAFFNELKKIIDSGEIGKVVSVVHNENVGDIHYSHSFCRGNWSNTAASSPMILAKSCHDTDIIQWIIGKKCLRLSSFGSLKYLNKENCPEGAPARCLDGCPHGDSCPYNARKLYLDNCPYKGWFPDTVAMRKDPTYEQVEAALQTGPYGRCVFQCDNDVVDHQTVNMEFEDGVTVMFSMCAYTPTVGRTIKIMGTKGQIRGNVEKKDVIVDDFLSQKQRQINLAPVQGHVGHGGGDKGIMEAFYELISGETSDEEMSTIRVSAENHMISFAAEESRLNGGKVIEL